MPVSLMYSRLDIFQVVHARFPNVFPSGIDIQDFLPLSPNLFSSGMTFQVLSEDLLCYPVQLFSLPQEVLFEEVERYPETLRLLGDSSRFLRELLGPLRQVYRLWPNKFIFKGTFVSFDLYFLTPRENYFLLLTISFSKGTEAFSLMYNILRHEKISSYI